MDSIALGQKIHRLREEKGLTQMQLAELIHMSDRTISRIEIGMVQPELSTLTALSRELKVSLDFLLSDDTDISKEMYIQEIAYRASKLDMRGVKHLLQYIDLYIKTETEYLISNNKT